MIRRFCSDRVDALRRFCGTRSAVAGAAVQFRPGRPVSPFFRINVFVILLTGLVVGGGWLTFLALESSDIFSLMEITVQGNRMTMKDQILACGGVEQGLSLLSLNIAAVEEGIKKDPWVDHVEIERVWPYTLNIRVYEHRPLAMINIGRDGEEELYYIDHHGVVFARVDQSQDIDFPVITGGELSEEILDTSIAGRELAGQAFEFLRIAARGNPIVPIQTVSEVHISRGKGIVVYLVEHPFPIYMGFDTVHSRYYQLVKLLERLYRKKKIEDIKEIRMDYQTGRILVARMES